jgi:uncharacterized protein YggE
MTLRTFLAFLLVFTASQAFASETHTVTVEGTCTHQVVPDRASITLTADVVDSDLKSATRQAMDEYEKTREAVKKLGLEDLEIKTSEYSVGENRVWQKDTSVLKGYRARMGLYVATSQIQRLGEVIAIASREDLKDVGTLTSFLSDEKTKQEQLSCLEEAAKDAHTRAEKLAQSLGSKVGVVISITQTASQSPIRPRPMLAMRNALVGGEAHPPQVEAGEEAVSVQIQAQFALSP